jgi:hypothetical protein
MPSATRRQRAPHRTLSKRGSVLGVLLIVVMTLTVSLPAQADQYPTWNDVQQAQSSEQRKQDEITRITALLDGLKSRAAAAEKTAARRAAVYEQAQGALTEATYRSDQLDKQTRAAERRATRSERRAGNVAASLARSGGDTLTTRMLIGKGAGGLLQRLELMSQLAKASSAIYAAAKRDRNDAAAVAAQAHAVKRSLGKLAAAAQSAFAEAKRTAEDAQTALSAQQTNQATLQAQLTVLQENRAATQADYEKGVAARRATRAAAATAAARRPLGRRLHLIQAVAGAERAEA